MEKLLIIDDSLPFLNDMELLLKGRFEVIKAKTGKSGLNSLRTENVIAVLLDLKLPDIDGLTVLKKIRNEIDPYIPVIIITDYANYESAVEAMKLGANDYIGKEINIALLIEKIKQLIQGKDNAIKIQTIRKNLEDQHDRFIYKSQAMKNLYYEIKRIAEQDFTVLLEGETGVGKDLIAREIHKLSDRKDGVFLQANISGQLNEDLKTSELFGHEKGAFTGAESLMIGLFESADHGTVYIPEIQDLSNNLQINLLNFIQYKSFKRVGQSSSKPDIKVDVRLIFASNRNVEKLVKDSIIREDFYYRIRVAKMIIPPLRERTEDIEPIVKYYVDKFSPAIIGRNLEISVSASELLTAYSWPGNTHELQGMIRMAILHCDGDILEPEHFTSIPGLQKKDKTSSFKSFEKSINLTGNSTDNFPEFKSVNSDLRSSYFNKLMEATHGDLAKAAKIAGMSMVALRKNLRRFALIK
jgi:two-component system NtrC family response regulator